MHQESAKLVQPFHAIIGRADPRAQRPQQLHLPVPAASVGGAATKSEGCIYAQVIDAVERRSAELIAVNDHPPADDAYQQGAEVSGARRHLRS